MRRGIGRRKRNAKDVAAEVARQDRRAKVLSMTVDGMSTRAIAKELGVSHVTVFADLKQALDERASRTREHSRAIATERIEAIVEANMPIAKGTIESAVDENGKPLGPSRVESGKLVLQAVALDARINGFEAPKQVEVTGKDGGAVVINVSPEWLRPAIDAVAEHVKDDRGEDE